MDQAAAAAQKAIQLNASDGRRCLFSAISVQRGRRPMLLRLGTVVKGASQTDANAFRFSVPRGTRSGEMARRWQTTSNLCKSSRNR